MNENPLISVITPVYNGAQYLPDLIESVLAQDYQHYEHIIIDDGSTDDGATVAVLEHYAAQYPHLRWWSRENRGQYATQNEAIDAARGHYIVVIAADDVFVTPDAFSRVVAYLRRQPDVDIVYGEAPRMDENGDPLPRFDLVWSPSRWLIRHLNYVPHCSMFVARHIITERRIRFDPTLQFTGDWDWVIQVFASGAKLACLRQPVAMIRMHQGQTSRNATPLLFENERREISRRYGGSYRVHKLLTQLQNWRSMAIIAWDALLRRGPLAVYRMGRRWLAKRRA